jgi:hypothetical protein
VDKVDTQNHADQILKFWFRGFITSSESSTGKYADGCKIKLIWTRNSIYT